MSLADFRLARGPLALAVQMAAADGETVALVGPNGAGKTTCLLALAGLVPVDEGTIRLDGRLLDGGPAEPFVPPEARAVGMVFQDALLFPGMTALDNVAYGLRCRGAQRATARRLAADWLERVGLADRGATRPADLSGGEAQRVALARALATEPRLLLLDEPLSAVDVSGRRELRRELRRHLAEHAGARVIVAHDIADVLALADRFVVLEAGRVVQSGTIEQIVARPQSVYVADLVGVNCFRGVARDGVVELEGGSLVVAAAEQGPVIVTVHPRAVALYRQRPEGSPRNVWAAPLAGIEPSLDRLRVQVGGPLPLVAELTPAAVADLRLDEGGEVFVAVKATEITVAPA